MKIAGFPTLYPADEAKKKYPDEAKRGRGRGGNTVEPTTTTP
jgi:hypothetical protein